MSAGRKPIQIDIEQFEKLCSLQCTLEEIAGYYRCSTDTIERWCKKTYGENFADVFRQKRGIGMISLRRAQFRMAEKNPVMAIWLGKQYLGQTEKQEVAVTAKVDDDTVREMENYFLTKKANEGIE